MSKVGWEIKMKVYSKLVKNLIHIWQRQWSIKNYWKKNLW